MSTIQVAFQGGGAKLVAMLPMVDAFRKAEQDGIVRITGVAGTSAGAICAALLATKADVSAAREFILRHGSELLQALVPDDAKRALHTFSGSKLKRYSLALTHLGFINRTVKDGEAILNANQVRALIRGVLGVGATDPDPTFDGLDNGRPLFVVSSDIAKARSKEHTEGSIVAAVEDSCSLPVLLRSFNDLTGSHLVDGGLCDNLPVECLLKNNDDPIFAVFPEERQENSPIDNLLKYLMALFSASISHNVARSIEHVQKPFQFGAFSEFGMLDFEDALAKLNDAEWYENKKAETYKRLKKYSDTIGATPHPYEAKVANVNNAAAYRRSLSRITSQFERDFEVEKMTYRVRVKCNLRNLSEADEKDREPDMITRTTTYRAARDGARYLQGTVGQDQENYIIPTIWSVWNESREAHIPIEALPLEEMKTELGVRTNCLIELVGEEQVVQDERIVLASSYHTSEKYNMCKLNQEKSDYIKLENIRDLEIVEGVVSLSYPRSLGTIDLVVNELKCEQIDFRKVKIDKSADRPHGDEQTVKISISPFPARAILYVDTHFV